MSGDNNLKSDINLETKQDPELFNESWPKWLILKDMYMTEKQKILTIKKLAELIDIDWRHPYFREMISFLIDNQAIGVKEILDNNTKIIEIDYKKLGKLIEKTGIFREFNELVEERTGGFYRI